MAPTIFIVPGFYEAPRTGKAHPDSPNMDDDIANIAKDLAPVVEEAGDEGVVAVMHSAGGFIGSGALKGLNSQARQDSGKAGGVKKIIFITAGVAPEGYEQGPMEFFDYHARPSISFSCPSSGFQVFNIKLTEVGRPRFSTGVGERYQVSTSSARGIGYYLLSCRKGSRV
ncbi:Uncharacterized protein HZ326_13365 [Fusarium oxysporum f. sp. albedinis]|nr:Uncharacterized protein HZ326_13365 [Fusarium oxysporum f. sp. albedinis]